MRTDPDCVIVGTKGHIVGFGGTRLFVDKRKDHVVKGPGDWLGK